MEVFETKNGKQINSKKIMIMGIINLTPDSFYSKSRSHSFKEGVENAIRLIEEGADIIDLGGESTRPGALPVDENEEKKRVIPVLKELRKNWNGLISIDTYKSEVAREAIDEGADIINDISGLRFDPQMVDVVSRSGIPVVIMHTSGRPAEMQMRTDYRNLMLEIINYISRSISMLCEKGYPEKRIIIDPGIGFGKTVEQNLHIIANLKLLKVLKRPILVGASRKSFIGALSGNVPPEERLPGSLAAAIMAVLNGARIIRTHDVKETIQAIKIASEILERKEV
uniref:dihydropteroate synthase n=1 Tax=uncultured prokaryote TaxID=198431 RepID=H5SPW9_9ZZZZ|nr:dihydropteroate synthase [uncultured prokaryote]